MKKILLGLVLATITATSVQAVEWRASCKSEYSNPSKGTYIFHVKKGEVGGCKSDKVKQRYMNDRWDWSERAEVKTRSEDMFGQWKWSANINIDRDCRPASRNTLFQVHAGGYLTTPPSWIGITRYNKFRTNETAAGTNVTVPDKPFKITAEISATKKRCKGRLLC